MVSNVLLDAVISVVIIFPVVIIIGLVISIGNERQRAELARIRLIADQWAIEDLKIKRAKLARDISIPDPTAWCNELVARVLQWNPNARVEPALSKPDALVMLSSSKDRILAISPVSPEAAQQFTKQASRLDRQTAQLAAQNPLFPYPRSAQVTELSPLNAGVTFDLEMEVVWKALTKSSTAPATPIWYLYEVPYKK
jgi:hypothetical protein